MSNIEIVIDDKSHLVQVRRLWEFIFSDDASSYLDFYFKHVYPNNIVVLAMDEMQVIGMIHMNPYELADTMIYYIVGVATLPEYRGKGIMKKMMEFAITFAKEKQIDELILLPVDERFYRSFGFDFVSYQYNTHILEPTKVYGFHKATDGSSIIEEHVGYHPIEINTFPEFVDAMNSLKASQGNKYLPYEAIWNVKYLENLFVEMNSEKGKIIEINGHIVLFYLEDFLEVRSVFYHPTNSIVPIKNWLIHTAGNRTIILHEVNQRVISNLFPYHQQNIYDKRPYMMLRSSKSNKNSMSQDIFFNEVV